MKFEAIKLEDVSKIILPYLKNNIIKDGVNILFYGDLGSGKTTLIKNICCDLGIDANLVTSPTFTIVNEYKGDYNIFHMDFYRVSEDELLYLEIDEILESKKGVKLIEWAEKFENYLPDNSIKIYINYNENIKMRDYVIK